METFIGILLKVFSMVMMCLFVLSVVLLILTVRKARKVSVLSLIITLIISLITLVIFSSLIKYAPPLWLWLLLFAIGVSIGWFWARATKVFVRDNQIMSINSVWYLVDWGAIFALNQLITIMTNRPPNIAMSLLIISTATIWGINGNVIKRYFKMKAEHQLAQVVPQQQATPHAQFRRGYCGQCGAAISNGNDAVFCGKCGVKL